MMSPEQLLMQDLVKVMLESIKDTGDKPYYLIEPNGKSGRVYTRQSQDTTKAQNGGDYHFYRNYSIIAEGVMAYSDWSSDFDYSDFRDPHQAFYEVDVESISLVKLFAQAEQEAIRLSVAKEDLS